MLLALSSFSFCGFRLILRVGSALALSAALRGWVLVDFGRGGVIAVVLVSLRLMVVLVIGLMLVS